MAVDVGSAVGYLDLDINGFLTSLRSAQSEADKASKNIVTKFGANMQSAGKKLTSAGSTLTKSVTVPIVGLGTAAIKTSSDFESAMSKVSAISGATGTNLDKLNKKAQEMGSKTKFSATEAANAFEYMAMAGWKTEDMLDGIEGIMNLAAASGEDLATTSDIVTDALTAFGLSAKDSGHFADVLAKASSSANTNVSMLGESFKYVAPVAGALGYSAEDTAIALGLMANAGIKGSQAGTALRGSISRLVKPTDDAAAMMDKYGISLTNADGTMKPLGEVMNNLREKLGGLSEAEQAQAAATLFGQEAMSGMLAIINASDSDYQSLTDSIYNADGAAQQMADTMLNNLSGQLTLLKSALEGLAIQFGEILMPYIKQFVGWLQSLVQKLQEMTPEQKEQIVKWAAFAAAIGPVLVVVGKLVTGIGGVISAFGKIPAIISSAKAAFTAIGAAIGGISAPVVAVVAIIGVLIAAFVNLWKTNEKFRNNLKKIWNQIKKTFDKFTKGIVDRLNQLGFNFKDITEVISAIWKGFCDLLAPYFEGVFQYIADTFEVIVNVILGVLDVFISIFKGDWTGAWNAIKGIFISIWTYIKDWFSNILNTIKGIFNVVLGWFGTSWEECWNGIKTFFEGIWNGIVSFFTGILTGIQNTFTTVFTAISTFFTTTWTNIKTFFEGIWNGLTSFLSSVWEGIKSIVSNAINSVKNTITTVFNAISSVVTTVWNTIKNTISTVLTSIRGTVSSIWNTIKSTISTVVNAISTTVSSVFNTIKSTTTTVWNAIKSAISTPINAAKNTVSSVVNTIKNTISNGFTAAKNTVSSIFDSIKSKISSVMDGAKSAVSNAISNIKSKFNFSWSLPHLKLPHVSIRGKFSLNPPSVPKFSISWYKKAMNNPMILNGATIFGAQGGKLLGGGEAGSEVVSGTNTLMKMIREAVASVFVNMTKTIQTYFDVILLNIRQSNTTLVESVAKLVDISNQFVQASEQLGYVTYNGFSKAREVIEKSNDKPGTGGGDTFIFNSPKAIDEIEAAKQMKQAKRDLAEGF